MIAVAPIVLVSRSSLDIHRNNEIPFLFRKNLFLFLRIQVHDMICCNVICLL